MPDVVEVESVELGVAGGDAKRDGAATDPESLLYAEIRRNTITGKFKVMRLRY